MKNDLGQCRIWNSGETINFIDKIPYEKELIEYKRLIQTIQIIVPKKVYYPHKTTELLLFFLYQTVKNNPQIKNALDVGAGTGLHSILLAKLGIRVTATDITAEACHAIGMNAKTNHVQENIRVIQANLLEGINKKYDLVALNLATSPTPPLTHELHHLAGGITIDGGFDGRFHLDQALMQADVVLNPNSFLLVSQTNTSNIGKTESFLTNKRYQFTKISFLVEAGEHTKKLDKFINENLETECHLKRRNGRYYYEIAVFVSWKMD